MYIPTFVQVLEFIGTFAFAISGIRLASAKQFDWFGAYVVGVATAIGGGTIRDLMLDVTPFWMTNSIYLTCSALALVGVILSESSSSVSRTRSFCLTPSVWLCLPSWE